MVLSTNVATLGANTAAVTLANTTILETSATNATVANAVTLSSGQATLSTASANSSLTMSNAVNGTGGLIKEGAGTLTLNGANGYTGNTAINAGKVILAQQSSLGLGAVTLQAGTTLETAANLDNTIQLTGDGDSNTTIDTVNLVVAQGQSSTLSKAVKAMQV